jgi:periplasmic protein TonB
MTGRPSLLWLGASIAAHGCLLAALSFVVSGESYSSPLIIDLSALETLTEGERKPAPRSERPAAGVRGSGPKRAGSEQPVERITAAPASPTPASPAPVVTPAPATAPEPVRPPEREVPVSKPEPREPEPALVAAAPREPDVAPSVTTSPAVGTNPAATAGSSADGAAGRTATQSSSASGGTSGGSGSRIALAPVGPSGNGGTGGSEYGSYYRQIRQRIQETLEYPAAARRRGITGTVLLELRIKPDGAISAVVKESSSHRVLDDAALETVRNLPRQPFPSGLAPRQLTVPLPVMFDLK